MPNKCNVVKCKCNYSKDYSCRVFRLPKDQLERQLWLDVLPPRENFVVNPDKFFICEKNWGADLLFIKLPVGFTRSTIPPSVFNVPTSCLPPCPVKVEDKQPRHFFRRIRLLNLMLSYLNVTYRSSTRT